MSGDTELFEKNNNMKSLWTSKQKIILYIPVFWGGCFEAAALFLMPKINVLIGVEKASFFFLYFPLEIGHGWFITQRVKVAQK